MIDNTILFRKTQRIWKWRIVSGKKNIPLYLNSLFSFPVMHITDPCEKCGFLTCSQETSFCNMPCQPTHVTELQNHRRVGAQRDLQSSSGPIALLKHGHLRLIVRKPMSRWLWDIPKDWQSTIPLDSLCQCAVSLKIKRCGQIESPVFHFVPFLWFCHGASLKKACLYLLYIIHSDIYINLLYIIYIYINITCIALNTLYRYIVYFCSFEPSLLWAEPSNSPRFSS